MSSVDSLLVSLFDDPTTASAVTASLVESGIEPTDISVVCSDAAKLEPFPASLLHPTVSEDEEDAVEKGAAFGIGAGAVIVTGALVTLTGLPIAILGALGAAAAVGPFTAMMVGRGIDDAAADFYDAEVSDGKILIAVSSDGTRDAVIRDRFAEAGGRMYELPAE